MDDMLATRLAALKAENEKLARAFADYAEHTRSCQRVQYSMGSCDCGLAEALD